MGRLKSFKLRRGSYVNGYEIRERLGRGWEGEVYRVREEYSQGQRVLKLFDPAQYRSRQMYKYGQKLEQLSDVSGIIRFYHGGYWEKRDCHYLVMRYVEGMPLERLVSKRSMPLFRALRVVRQVLKIVQDCHQLKYRVGDIHADNIILVPGDRPFIIDLDLGARLNRETAVEDVTAVCKLLYGLNWAGGPYPNDLKKAFPKHTDALKARYQTPGAALDALHTLMGV